MMKSLLKTKSAMRFITLLTTIATISIALMLCYILYMLHGGADIPAVLWCGTTIIDPLALTANVLLPIGVICHIGCVSIIFIKTHRTPIFALTHMAFFTLLSVAVILIGVHYCATKLEGVSFASLVWWL